MAFLLFKCDCLLCHNELVRDGLAIANERIEVSACFELINRDCHGLRTGRIAILPPGDIAGRWRCSAYRNLSGVSGRCCVLTVRNEVAAWDFVFPNRVCGRFFFRVLMQSKLAEF